MFLFLLEQKLQWKLWAKYTHPQNNINTPDMSYILTSI